MGRDALMNELADTMIPYTPEELIAIAQTEYDWCMNEMLKASREMGFGDDWHAAVEKVKTMHVPTRRAAGTDSQACGARAVISSRRISS